MTTVDRAERSPARPRSAGGLLIGAAVVLGVVLLGKGFDTGFLGSSSGDPSDRASPRATTTTATTTATTATHHDDDRRRHPPARRGPRAGAQRPAARRRQCRYGHRAALGRHGYVVIDATNATDRTATATAVYAAAGYEADAARPSPRRWASPAAADADDHAAATGTGRRQRRRGARPRLRPTQLVHSAVSRCASPCCGARR